jgi:hypothetical protein
VPRRVVPGMGTLCSFWARTQAKASWEGCTPFSCAISVTRSTNSRFF